MATNGHPATPPPSDPSAGAPASSTQAAPQPALDIERPLTAGEEDPDTKKPRDARLIHAVLASQGISNYQQRVPLQLLDFAYRYSSGVLSDSLRLSAEGYASVSNSTTKRTAAQSDDVGNITLNAIRQAVASRSQYTFQGPQPKDVMLEAAEKTNRVALPRVERGYGVQLPPEKFCLTGTGWGLKEEWESDEEEEEEVGPREEEEEEDERMGGVDGMEADDEDEEGAGRMEDVFGESNDTTMAD